MNFKDIKTFPFSGYRVRTDWKYLKHNLERYKERIVDNKVLLDGLDLSPDFQRGHVWTQEQKIAYVEYCLQGGISGRTIYFNNPTWQGSYSEPTVLVDGKQRVQAVLDFMDDKVPIWGHFHSEWEGHTSLAWFEFYINKLKTRAEVIEWYLFFNAGGTPHSQEEISRVRGLLEAEKARLRS